MTQKSESSSLELEFYPRFMKQLDLFYSYCNLQGLSPTTIAGLKSALSIYLRRFPEPFQATATEVIAFFSEGKSHGFATDRPASPSRYNNIRNSLNKFYCWAIQSGYTRTNPIAGIPRSRMPKAIPRRLSDEDRVRVLYHAQNFPHKSRYLRARNYAIVATLLVAGLRARELLALRNEDVRLQEHTLRIRHGKGNKERLVFFGDELTPILHDYLAERDRIRKESLWFFVSYRSNLAIRYKNLREMLVRVSRRARVRFTAHQLRHTCFSTLAEQDVDLRSIQAQAGHSSIISTQIYTHISDKVRREKIRRVSFLSTPRY